MKTQSTKYPNKYRIKNNKIIFTDNVQEIEKNNEFENDIIYEYDEYELEIVIRNNMNEYVGKNYDTLLSYIKNEYKLKKLIPSIKDVENAEMELKILSILSEVI